MIEQCERYLDCKNYLRQKIATLIDAFVAYYGEENRQEIEEKFRKSLLIAYRNPNTNSRFLSEIKDIHSNELFANLFTKFPSIWTRDDLFENYNLEQHNIFPLTYFQRFYADYCLGENGIIKKYKEEALRSIQSWIPEFTQEDYEEMIQTQVIPKKYEHLHAFLKERLLELADLSNPIREFEYHFKQAKSILKKINPNVTIENFSQIMEQRDIQILIKYAELLPTLVAEYKSRMQEYEVYEQEEKFANQLHNQLSNEYYLRFIEENIDLLSEADRQKVEIFKGNLNKSYVLTSYTGFIFKKLNSDSPFEAFSEESEKVLNDPKESFWKKDSIINDRIRFFKENGIDLGDDYDAYLRSDDAKRIWPTFSRVQQFIESRVRLWNEFNNAYYTSLPAYKEVRQEINALNLLIKDDGFDASRYVFKEIKGVISSNIVRSQNGYELFPLVMICCDSFDGKLDQTIIHELNHLIETALLKIENNNHCFMSCGWDFDDGEFNQEEEPLVDTVVSDAFGQKRLYELFSETINEYIAQEIHQLMLEKDQCIFDTKENTIIAGNSYYQHMFFLIRDFFQEFRKEILESRRNGNIEIIWNKVGKENFDELNHLFAIFYKSFPLETFSLKKSLENHEDNEQTRIYWELVARRDAILEKMRNYSMTQGGFLQTEESPKKKM